jgi:hypothetical protein
MKSILPFFLLAALPLYSVTAKTEGPSVNNYVDGTQIFIKKPKSQSKQGGSWFYICRLEASAERLVKPVAHLHIFDKKLRGGRENHLGE